MAEDSTDTRELFPGLLTPTGAPAPSLLVSEVAYSHPPVGAEPKGLLGFVSLLLNGLVRVDGIAIRRTTHGRLALSYPTRTDRLGREHPYFLPVREADRKEVERQVFEALDGQGWAP